jgi:hypothetical protein
LLEQLHVFIGNFIEDFVLQSLAVTHQDMWDLLTEEVTAYFVFLEELTALIGLMLDELFLC